MANPGDVPDKGVLIDNTRGVTDIQNRMASGAGFMHDVNKTASEVAVLRAIVGRLELELRTAHAFLGMALMSQGGSMEVPEEAAEALPDDFEIKVTRDDKVATFTVISGPEAAEFRKQQFVNNPIVVPRGETGSIPKTE
jgi:hypothetical protein